MWSLKYCLLKAVSSMASFLSQRIYWFPQEDDKPPWKLSRKPYTSHQSGGISPALKDFCVHMLPHSLLKSINHGNRVGPSLTLSLHWCKAWVAWWMLPGSLLTAAAGECQSFAMIPPCARFQHLVNLRDTSVALKCASKHTVTMICPTPKSP